MNILACAGRRLTGLVLFALLMLVMLGPTSYAPIAHAASYQVTNLNDDNNAGSLRWAINQANAAGGTNTINFSVSGTIALTGSLPWIARNGQTLTIDGSGQNITISGENLHSILTIPNSGGTATQTVYFKNLTIANGYNGADQGWAGILAGGRVYIDNCVFTGHRSTLTNGALTVLDLTSDQFTVVNNSVFSGNSIGTESRAGFGGSAITASGYLTVTNSVFTNNMTYGTSGAVDGEGQVYIANSTFSGNSVTGNGGAAIVIVGELTLVNSTFSGNSAALGAALRMRIGTATVSNTIFANPTLGSNCSGTITNGGNNIDDGTSCGFGSTNGSMSSTNPRLGALTGGVFPLLPGSPAINGVTHNAPNGAPSTDQRGVVRPQGTFYDIGAFEARALVLSKTSGDNQSSAVNTAFPAPLVVGVSSPEGDPVDGGQVILTGPSSGAGTNPTVYTATIASGAVTQTVSANATIGGPYNVTVSTSNATPAYFGLTNTAALVGTTTAVGTSLNPSAYTQAVTFTATVTRSNNGAPVTAGTVAFKDGGVTSSGCGARALDGSGHATCVTSALAVGAHTVTAEYSGDATYAASTGTLAPDQQVDKANQTITITASAPASAAYDAGFAVTATASSGLAVSYSSGSTGVCTNSGGTFTMVAATGTCVVQYDQGGDGNYAAAPQRTENVAATKAAATVALGHLSQTYDGTSKPITTTTSPAGLAVTTTYNGSPTAPTNAGTYSVTATISDTTYAGANSAMLVIAQAASTTTLLLYPTATVSGQTVTLTATVSSDAGTPAGTVQFYADGAAVASPVTLASGRAVTETASLVAGSHSITATYAGLTNWSASTAGSKSITVTNPVPTIGSISPDRARVGGSGFTLTVLGTNFVNGSIVRLNGADRATTFVDTGTLTAVIPASDQTSARTAQITVYNPAPGGGTTADLPLVVWKSTTTYLPLMIKDGAPTAPDLVVRSVAATGSNLQVVIANQGTASVVDPFWVDLYVNPNPAPAAVNQVWWQVASHGAVWGVASAALPLAPNQTLTLSLGDAYYWGSLSTMPSTLPAGTSIYVQVDAANTNSTYGGVKETHEYMGGTYNNISMFTLTSALSLVSAQNAQRAAAAPASNLPVRPVRK